MLVNPIVEELIVAAPTAELAMERFVLEEENATLVVAGWPNDWVFGCIRICPPLKVARRFRAFVTWVPVIGAN